MSQKHSQQGKMLRINPFLKNSLFLQYEMLPHPPNILQRFSLELKAL